MDKEKINQKMLAQVDIEKRNDSLDFREEFYNKKYLSEIILDEKPKFGSNNLILAPVGSGKSHLIESLLIPKDFDGKALYLTSNTALKDSLCPDNNEVRKALAEKGESVKFYTSKNKKRYGDKPYSVHVMTYKEFGERVQRPYETFTKDFSLIFCDEIHSLPIYLGYKNNLELGMALNWLLLKREGKKIFYFTATKMSIDKLEKKGGYLDVVKTFDYLNHPDIRKYVSNSTYYINNISQMRPHLRARLESFNYHGYKALAFTRLKSEQNKIKEIAIEEGFKPIVLWSVNNEEKMSEEQLKVREFILKTGLIPEPYNLLIINGAMQEGWNLYDDKVNLAILDTTDSTEQIQSLGRIRKSIDLVIKKTNDKNAINSLEIPKSYINSILTSEDKRALCDELYLLDERGRLKKWPTVSKYLEQSGYIIEEKVRFINEKKTRVSIITVKE